MQEFKGTPGPWEWRKDGYAGSVYNKRGFLVSGNVIPVHEDREDGESWLEMMERTDDARETARLESEANTLLIAAAPELLEALQALTPYVITDTVACRGDKCREPWCMSCGPEDKAEIAAEDALAKLRKAHAVIAKALGQTQQQR